jgi:hypothetical protein
MTVPELFSGHRPIGVPPIYKRQGDAVQRRLLDIGVAEVKILPLAPNYR